MSTPTRSPNGISTDTQNGPLGMFILPDPRSVHQYFDDFDTYTAANWTVTETGTATQALNNSDGGVLLVTNAASDDDASFSNKVGESFLLASGKKAWFDCRFKVSDATQSDVVIGLQITDTAPLAVTDGVYFLKADASPTMNMLVTKDSVSTTTAVHTMVSDTYVRLSFYYNGIDAIKVFADGVHVGTSVVTNLPDDEVLTVSFGIQNGEAVAKTMSIDYIMAAKER